MCVVVSRKSLAIAEHVATATLEKCMQMHLLPCKLLKVKSTLEHCYHYCQASTVGVYLTCLSSQPFVVAVQAYQSIPLQ